uniref:Uncharacterized protein n=1 Tax=Gopherus agassizii TaxID=38772 RepID=A0A452I3S6_9SAUR
MGVGGLGLAVQLVQQHQLGAFPAVRPRLRLDAEVAVARELEALDGVGAHVRVQGDLQRQAGAGRGALGHLERDVRLGEARRVVVDVPHLQLHVHQPVLLLPEAHHVESQDALEGLAAQPLPVDPFLADAQLPVALPHLDQRAVAELLHQPETAEGSVPRARLQIVPQHPNDCTGGVFLVRVVPDHLSQASCNQETQQQRA